MATYGELKAQIKRDLQRDVELSTDSSTALADDTISYYVKAAIAFYAIKPLYLNEATATLTTVTSQKTLGTGEGFPTDFSSDIFLVQDADNIPVQKVDMRFMLEQERSVVSTQNEAPSYYTIYSDELRVFPEPDSVFTMTLYYTKELSELSGDSSTNAWTTDGDRLIRSRAMGDIYAYRLHDQARASTMYQIADNEFMNLQEHDNNRNSSGYLVVPNMV